MNQLKYNERIYRIKNKQEAWEGLTWVLPLLNINPMKALKALEKLHYRFFKKIC